MKLFEPITVGSLKLKNRIAMPAMHLCYTPDGMVNERLIRYYEARASGGAALITLGGCTIDLLGPGPMMVGLHDDKFIAGLTEFTLRVKSSGAAVAAQLYQAGRYTHSMMSGQQPAAPSAIASRLTKETPREMTLEDIEVVIENFGEAARRAKEAGFDAVEAIASAGYLICQFLSPITNQREDQYGGSWENRTRFGIEVIRKIRVKTGSDFTIMVRLSGNDFMPGSNTNKEAAAFAALLEEAGVDCFNVTGGWHESRVPQITGELPRGGYAYLAGGIKKAVGVPVMASNRINDPLVAEAILQHHLADLVNMGRPLLADPDLPKKAAAGDFHAIRRCIACNQGCLDMVFSLQDVHCTVNPLAGREDQVSVLPAETAKEILVIGGGPAGLEIAYVAASRGHKVTLWERSSWLGGNLRYAAMPPGKEDFITLLGFYEEMLARYGVTVLLNHDANVDQIVQAGVDLVVLASGSLPIEAPFPVSNPKIITTALEVLDGTVIPGEKVVVIGGGSVGCETAITIAEMGAISAETVKFLLENDAETPEKIKELANRGTREVTLVEMEKGIGRDIGISTRWVTLKSVDRLGVRVLDQHLVKEVTNEGVLVEKEGIQILLPADTVVLAIGAKANNSLANELEGKVKELRVIGDAAKPRKLTEAIREGFDLARSL
ncbi:MAG: FAD-dependent oxidoreductase [Firmicutes bacterium]|nr:FAD-dependent oxidoreductase [Bacillota bacterium]